MLLLQRCFNGGGEIRLIVGFQPIMVISPAASWIRWCMQVNAWWFNVDLSCLGRMIYARKFLGAKPPIQFRHRWAERNSDSGLRPFILTEPPSRMLNSLCQARSWEAQTSQFLHLWCDAVGDHTRPPAPWADALTTRLRGGGSGYTGLEFSKLLKSKSDLSQIVSQSYYWD